MFAPHIKIPRQWRHTKRKSWINFKCSITEVVLSPTINWGEIHIAVNHIETNRMRLIKYPLQILTAQTPESVDLNYPVSTSRGIFFILLYFGIVHWHISRAICRHGMPTTCRNIYLLREGLSFDAVVQCQTAFLLTNTAEEIGIFNLRSIQLLNWFKRHSSSPITLVNSSKRSKNIFCNIIFPLHKAIHACSSVFP